MDMWEPGDHCDDDCCRTCYVSNDDKKIIFLISLSLGIISLCGSLAIIGHAILKRTYYTLEIRPLFHLMFANTGFSICLIVSSVIYITTDEEDMDDVRDVFLFITAFEEIFYLTAFFLTANYAIVVYIRLKDMKNDLDKQTKLLTTTSVRWYLKLAYWLSWLLPPVLLIPISIVVLDSTIKLCEICPTVTYCPTKENTAFDNAFLSHYGSILVIVTYIVISCILLGFYSSSGTLCTQLLNRADFQDSQKASVRWLRQRLTLYMLCFFYCWTPTFIIAALSLILDSFDHNDHPSCTFLIYIWAVTAPTQGLLLAATYFFSAYQTGRGKNTPGRGKKGPFGTNGPVRIYGSGGKRSRWPSRDGSTYSPIRENEECTGTSKTERECEVVVSPNRKKVRSPVFVSVLRDTDRESADDTGEE